MSIDTRTRALELARHIVGHPATLDDYLDVAAKIDAYLNDGTNDRERVSRASLSSQP